MMAPAIGWNHPDTARHYAQFQRRFARYRQANEKLVKHAALAPGMQILDVGAGDGETTATALAHIGEGGTVLCFEPANAMRALGKSTLTDDRVTWTSRWPVGPMRFDRVLCGAAIWQILPLQTTFRKVFKLLREEGCFCFNMPTLYLGEPDPPGGGRDPLLMELPASLATQASRLSSPAQGVSHSCEKRMDSAAVDALLAAAGFQAQQWRFSTRLDQRAYREWLKIPPTTDHLLLGLNARERARLIDRAFKHVDPNSWRWEQWTGWTAWKQ